MSVGDGNPCMYRKLEIFDLVVGLSYRANWRSQYRLGVGVGNPVMQRRLRNSVCGMKRKTFCDFFSDVDVVVGNPVMDRKVVGGFVCGIRNKTLCGFIKGVDVVVGNPVMDRKVVGNSVCDIRNKSFCAFLWVWMLRLEIRLCTQNCMETLSVVYGINHSVPS